MAQVKSKTNYTSRASRGLSRIPSISKHNRKIVGLSTYGRFKSIMSKISFHKDARILIKRQIEEAITRLALNLYEYNKKAVCWGLCVRAIKEGHDVDPIKTFHLPSRNENTKFEVKIKTSDIDKYKHLIGEYENMIKQKSQNRKDKKNEVSADSRH